MERDVAWKKYDEADLEALEHLAAEYIDFISDNKTERECAASAVALAEEHGYLPLDQAVREGRTLKAGDKVWAQAHGKALILAHLGQKPLEQGLNILGAHIDSPRLDLKQNPLYESNGFTLFDTHYYGGIKNYQWVTLPLALHGVIAKKDGTVVDVQVGDDPDDPVFCVTDLLVHLAGKQMAKKANEVVEGEDLDILMGNRPLTCGGGSLDGTQSLGSPGSHGRSAGLSGSCGTRLVGAAEAPGESAVDGDPTEDVQAPAGKEEEKEPVKAFALKLLAEKYGIEEEDFLSAEIEVVPAGRARDLGFDRSMVIGYGQDDRVCAYTSQGGDRQRGRHRHGIAVLREHHGRDHGACRRGRPAAAAPRASGVKHAVVRRVRRLRPRLRQRVRGEELRVFGARPGVQQVHGQPRQERLQRCERRVRGAHPPRHG